MSRLRDRSSASCDRRECRAAHDTRTSLCSGFTLLELLVALAVFAVAAALAWGGLDTLARARRQLEAQGEQLAELQRGLGRFERDLRQALARPVRAEGGVQRPALVGTANELELSVWLPASTLTAPAELQRVAWRCSTEGLQRLRWQAPDRTAGTAVHSAVLVPGAQACRLRYYPEQGQPVERWPAPGMDAVLPRAVELEFQRPGAQGQLEEFRRLLELPQNPGVRP